MTTTAAVLLAVAALSLVLLAWTVHVVFRDTPGPRTTPPRSHVPDSFASPWDLAA
ncbi:hypothetical protein [Nocardioides sp. CFH 31398]|uniref:hypothetical protein n=1 Tax=Nocardioides sp. CFH 31398 TaxID=2919579 RepID=UPI001F05B4BD|nr:hypothetical protein [Nocardioides sp. CFH 31398]MCH1868330.1 hypothetical protein [Nocardioides sp. CFH 31398]